MKTVIRITQKKNPDFIRIDPDLYPGRIIRIETEIRIGFTYKIFLTADWMMMIHIINFVLEACKINPGARKPGPDRTRVRVRAGKFFSKFIRAGSGPALGFSVNPDFRNSGQNRLNSGRN